MFTRDTGCYEKAARFKFDDVVGEWTPVSVMARMEAESFAVGRTRNCHRMWMRNARGKEEKVVAKFFKGPATPETYMEK
eukprot:875656-Rhodomonas_salina.1